MSKHRGDKSGKLWLTDGRRPALRPRQTLPYHNTSRLKIKIDANLFHSNLIYSKIKLRYMQNVSWICRSKYEKSGKPIFSSKRGVTPTKIVENWWHSTLIWKSYTTFQFNMSKHVGEKCGNLCISSILSFKTGITPTKIDGNWLNSNSICFTLKWSNMQNFSSKCQSN